MIFFLFETVALTICHSYEITQFLIDMIRYKFFFDFIDIEHKTII